MLLKITQNHPVFLNGKVVELAAGETVEINDGFIVDSLLTHGKAVKANPVKTEPKAEEVEDPSTTFDLENATAKELKSFAEANAIDLGDAKSAKDIREVVREFLVAAHQPAPVEASDDLLA